MLDLFVMITFKEKRRNGYTAIYTRKLLSDLVTHIYWIGRNKNV